MAVEYSLLPTDMIISTYTKERGSSTKLTANINLTNEGLHTYFLG